MTDGAPIRVLIVDDHPIVRRGLVDLFVEEAGMAVVGAAANAHEALALAVEERPDVAVLDLVLGNDDGFALAARLRASAPATAILVLSSHDERLYAARAMRSGARGYIMKDQPADALVAAVRQVASGRPYLSGETTARVLASLGSTELPVDRLSPRERHVFELLGRGLTTRQIADELTLSVKTVETYLANLKEKLGAESGRDLVRLALTAKEGP